jgi:hypothetical protein
MDPMTGPEPTDDPVEGGEDVVQLRDQGAGVPGDRHVGEAGEIGQEHGRRLEEGGRGGARVLQLLVDASRHDVQEEFLDALLLELQLPGLPLRELGVRVEHVLGLFLLRDVLDVDDHDTGSVHILGPEIDLQADAAGSQGDLGLESIGTIVLQAIPGAVGIAVLEEGLQRRARPVLREQGLEPAVGEQDGPVLGIRRSDPRAGEAGESLGKGTVRGTGHLIRPEIGGIGDPVRRTGVRGHSVRRGHLSPLPPGCSSRSDHGAIRRGPRPGPRPGHRSRRLRATHGGAG